MKTCDSLVFNPDAIVLAESIKGKMDSNNCFHVAEHLEEELVLPSSKGFDAVKTNVAFVFSFSVGGHLPSFAEKPVRTGRKAWNLSAFLCPCAECDERPYRGARVEGAHCSSAFAVSPVVPSGQRAVERRKRVSQQSDDLRGSWQFLSGELCERTSGQHPHLQSGDQWKLQHSSDDRRVSDCFV